MKTRREYLAEKGLAIAGARGKFSNAAKQELARAEAAGMRFKEVTPNKSVGVSKSTGPVKSVEPTAPKASESPYIYPSDFRFPEGEYVAKDANGKVYGMRECCNTCKVSLTNHMCNTPSIHGNITVTIVRR